MRGGAYAYIHCKYVTVLNGGVREASAPLKAPWWLLKIAIYSFTGNFPFRIAATQLSTGVSLVRVFRQETGQQTFIGGTTVMIERKRTKFRVKNLIIMVVIKMYNVCAPSNTSLDSKTLKMLKYRIIKKLTNKISFHIRNNHFKQL